MNIEVSVLSERNGLPSEDIIAGFKVIYSRTKDGPKRLSCSLNQCTIS